MSQSFQLKLELKETNITFVEQLQVSSAEAKLFRVKIDMDDEIFITRISPIINIGCDLQDHTNQIKIQQRLADKGITVPIIDYGIIHDEDDIIKIIHMFDVLLPENEKTENSIYDLIKKNRTCSIILMEEMIGFPYTGLLDTKTINDEELRQIATEISLQEINDEIRRKIYEMHKLGVIHNDLHSDNIFINVKHGVTPYVIDFGLSQMIDSRGTKLYENFLHKQDIIANNLLSLQNVNNLSRMKDPSEKFKAWMEMSSNPGTCFDANWCCERVPGGPGELLEDIMEGEPIESLNKVWPIIRNTGDVYCPDPQTVEPEPSMGYVVKTHSGGSKRMKRSKRSKRSKRMKRSKRSKRSNRMKRSKRSKRMKRSKRLKRSKRMKRNK